jgi:hypothetical protein
MLSLKEFPIATANKPNRKRGERRQFSKGGQRDTEEIDSIAERQPGLIHPSFFTPKHLQPEQPVGQEKARLYIM